MLREGIRWLRWDPEDAMVMTRILGPDAASKEKAPIHAPILKAAKAQGIQLEDELNDMLRDERWFRHFQKRVTKADDALPQGYPSDLLKKLFAHQRVALQFMSSGLPAYLVADQPGVGKTAPAIMWADRVMGNDPRSRTLVITPNSAKAQWSREIHRWTHTGRPISILDGTTKLQRKTAATKNGWVIGHWQSLVHASRGMHWRPWNVVILDEGHAIRNRETQTAQNAFKLDVTADHKLVLTAHPFVNSPDEFWSILRFLYPDDYSSFWRFWSIHVLAQPKYWGGFEIMGTRDPQLLRWEIMPFMIRRTKRQVFSSLPPITRTPRYVDLPKKHAKEYDRLTKELFVELDAVAQKDREEDVGFPRIGGQWLRIPNVLARTVRLRQYLTDPGILGASAPSLKYPIALELIQELDGPPVVFTMFKDAAERFADVLRDAELNPGLIHGDISSEDRDTAQRAFLEGSLDALIITTSAGGEALNLGKYGYLIYLDLPFTPKDIEQTEGRVDRPEEGTGKLVPTTAYYIVTRGTYEEKQMAKIEKKKGMFDDIFGAGSIRQLFERFDY